MYRECSRRLALGACVIVLGASLSACDSSGAAQGDQPGAPSDPASVIRVDGSEPRSLLLPSDTSEEGGAAFISMLFRGLVRYDTNRQPQMEMAESITTDDNKLFHVTLKKGQVFSDGSPVDSASFVNAWNYAANKVNNQKNNYFFEPIQGYDDLNPPGADTKPTTDKMSGLVVVNPLQFDISLSQPHPDFLLRLGYMAFAPMPASAFKDLKAFGEKPIGNGPYVLESWEHGQRASFRKNERYTGGDVAQNAGVDLLMYQRAEAAYADLKDGNLDLLTKIPTTARSTFRKEFGDQAIVEPSGHLSSIVFPFYDTVVVWKGENGAKLRKAFSMAINRQELVDTVLNGLAIPARDFSSPVVQGYDDTICGELCTYDPKKARQLYDEAGGYQGVFSIAYNVDSPHRAWVEAVCKQLSRNLGVACHGQPYPDFAALLKDRSERKITTSWRDAWQMDYPALENFLGPVFAKGAGANDAKYYNSEFEAKLRAAATADNPEQAIQLYKDAERVLVNDPPSIPLWYGTVQAIRGRSIHNVTFGVSSFPFVWAITKDKA